MITELEQILEIVGYLIVIVLLLLFWKKLSDTGIALP